MKAKSLVFLPLAIMLLAAGCNKAVQNEPPSSNVSQSSSAEEEKMMKEKEAKMMEEKSMMAMKMAMEDKSSRKIVLKDVSGGKSTGTAYILRKDGKLYHTVVANLPEPPTGQFYEGWLVRDPVKKDFFSTGKLTKQADGTYEVSYTSDNLYAGYDFVVVTLEKVMDSIPEKHILEGK